VWLWRRHVEQVRIAAERDAAQLAALERSVATIVARARADMRLPGLSAAFALPDGRVGQRGSRALPIPRRSCA
jgi:hypothetical protein